MVVQCQTVSELMKIAHGDIIFLNIAIARKMQARGEVKIVTSQNGEPFSERLKQLDDSAYLIRKAFSNDGKTKVAWIQDYHKDGGAELSNFVVVRAGNNCGFDIVGITPVNFNMEIIKQSDMVIVNNFFEFSEDEKQSIVKYLYESKKPYVKYEHDHRELDRPGFSSRLLGDASLVVFISPEHQSRYAGKIECKNMAVLPLAIDTRVFTNSHAEREGNSLFIPSFNKCRTGAMQFIFSHPELKYTIIGSLDISNLKAKVKLFGSCSVSDMVKHYNESETVLHLPEKPGGGERVIFEAVLCGCKVICNENASHSSWNYYQDEAVLRKELDKAPYTFWRQVAKCLQKA